MSQMTRQGVRYDLLVEPGLTFRFPFNWKQSDNTPINLTGYSFTLHARDVRTKQLVISLSTGAGITVTATDGRVELYISDTITDDYTFLIANYDIEYIAPNGDKDRLLYGYIRTSEDVKL